MADSGHFFRGTRMRSYAALIGVFWVFWSTAQAASEHQIVEYVDPTYGSKVRHLQQDDGHEHNLYYYRNPWNADSTRMVGIQSDLQQKNWQVVLYDGDGRFLRALFPISQFDWRLAWDRNDPHLLYTWQGARLYRFRADTGRSELLKDFAPLGLKPNGPSLNEAGDRLLVATSDGAFRSYRLPALDEERTFTPAVPAGCSLHWDKPHYLGYQNCIDTAYSSATPGREAIVIYDDTGKVVHTFDGIGGGGHYTFSPEGRLAYFKLPVGPRRGPERPLEIHVVNLDGTDDRVLVSMPWAKASYVQNLHLAWPSRVKDWFIASFFPSAGNAPTTYAAPLDEILLVRTDGTSQYLARTGTVYSRAGARGATGDMFWAQPLATPSSDGRRICFNSNRAGTIDQYILYPEPSATPSQPMALVRDGQAIAVIVVDEPAAPGPGKGRQAKGSGLVCSDSTAARVLADWIEKITDVRLPIVAQAPEGGPAIYVGKAALAAGLKLDDIDSPTGEGLRLVRDGRARVLLAGQNEQATVKAACRFLEQLGCRYFMDDPLGEVYPRATTLTVGPLTITEKPGFLLRKIWGSQWTGQTLWKIWNGDGGTPLSTQHAWGAYVDQGLFDTHPEYFALRNGERQKGDWYCTSNPELRRVFAQGVLARGESNPSISPPDGTGYCRCDACRAQDDPKSLEPSSGTVNVTNRYVDFFDAVAKEVAKVHPEWLLNFYCYADYTQPPTTNIKLSPNLVAWIAPIRYSRFHRIGSPNSPSTTQLADVIDKWAASAQHIAYRTYNYNLAECLVPFSKLSLWAHDIPYLKAKGCLAINLESLANWEIYGPHMYQSIRLAYDPDVDAEALMEDYFLKFYGPQAGPFLKQYWLSLDRAFADLKCESGSFYALHLVYTREALEQWEDLLRKAADAVKDNPSYAARVALSAEGLRNARQYIQMRDAMNRGDFRTAQGTYDDLHARNEAEVAKGYSNKYTPSYLQRFVGTQVAAGAAATAAPNRVLQVLPDRMKLAYDADNKGQEQGWHQPDFDDAGWREVATYSNTLNAQGLPDTKSFLWYRTSVDVPGEHKRLRLFFTEVDGQAVVVYVNGKQVASLGKEASRQPFEVDVTEAVTAGRNLVALKIDHRRITELFLGGILRPILLIEKPDTQ